MQLLKLNQNSDFNASFYSPVVPRLVPYVPGEQPKIDGLVKLNTNENPYPPSPRVLAAIHLAAQQGLQLYPDPEATALRQTIAAHHRLAPQQVFLGNGSDEVLAHAFFAFFQHGCPLLIPDISYSFYQVYCRLYGIPVETVPLTEALCLDVAAYARSDGAAVAGVVIANPNAPTGVGLPLQKVEQLLRLHPQRVVLVDEAYVDFGGDSAIGLIAQYPNLLVVHTLSKSRSLAGLRIGFACGQAHLIEALERVKNSFNSYPLDRLAIAGGVAAFEDQAWFEQTRRAVMSSREGLVLALEDLGFQVLPSQANFVFARHPQHDAQAIAAALRSRGVLVRHFQLARIEQYLRISIGTPAQCDALLQALASVLATLA
ncbi:MAG: histidinol-phosphate transaminase [Gammaproteobacteria bacterium]|nr:histidinol-phosphate transaminase [Rhodoferax sp.]MBU3897788.1 histidinol-phosphate transaminase [Gammaproteobacteria bacterium]MBU3997265.1 histidinol-phosphate transaminase [Gammaproteobacteria bacterium]MBU4017863.1 histidinol-phosphate transaminase [Gammaproteobacteria bacterium]MBU4078682.1 histidinol-phosphate transaminase [Gammaproteobacteria bacterium]